MNNMYAQIGVFHTYIVSPFSWLINHFAGWFGGSFGLALIAITILVRLALMPFMINQFKKQRNMRTKTAAMQPELEAIKQKYAKSKDPDARKKQSEETMALYQKHGFNPLAMGCLPMLIQLPILSGLYYAIRSNPEMTHHTFLWFKLGLKDPIMPFLAAGVYLVQAMVTKSAQPPAIKGQPNMSWLIYLSPVMMGIFSLSAPAALPLYWCVGGFVLILQTLISKKLYPAEGVVLSQSSTGKKNENAKGSNKQAGKLASKAAGKDASVEVSESASVDTNKKNGTSSGTKSASKGAGKKKGTKKGGLTAGR